LTANGPRIEALVDDWLSLERISRLSDLLGDHGVGGNGVSDMLPILQLGAPGWQALNTELRQLQQEPLPAGPLVIPIAPLLFRDFMLYEQHAIDAARGYVRRFMPGAYRIAGIVETLTRRPFPKFRPHQLWYSQPIYYFGNHLNFLTEGQAIPWPGYTDALDYELELGAVLAHPLRDASAEEATAAIGGFVVVNDLSARDVQLEEMRSGFGPQKSKHFASVMSAELVTSDEVLPCLDGLDASVSINGRQVAQCSTRNAHYTLTEAIAFASKDEALHPGELFGSGTLPGGCGMENGHWLQPGDHLTLAIEGVGRLCATVGSKRGKA
jgi:2-keto-4-pentenoate hydratase/2-oxohepta-3-ene-1,7-dioic acid hydratase in catechol pathway